MERPSNRDIFQNVQSFLNEHGVSLASLVIDALRDPRSSLTKDLITRITDVLDALRPHLDDGPIAELGRFFASITSSELSELGQDNLWCLPASNLSAAQLQGFSMKKMSQRIASAAPGFSSFLHSVCVGKKAASGATGVGDGETDIEPDQLLEIVCPPPFIFI